MVRHSRANFLAPVPPVRTLDELKARWEESCRGDLGRRPRGQGRRKEALLLEDGAAMRGPPEAAFDASRVLATRAGNLSLVRFDGNDHSVPVRCAHRDEERVAEHRRIWERERVRFDPVHYLALLERNPGALDFARPPGRLGVARVSASLAPEAGSRSRQRGHEGIHRGVAPAGEA